MVVLYAADWEGCGGQAQVFLQLRAAAVHALQKVPGLLGDWVVVDFLAQVRGEMFALEQGVVIDLAEGSLAGV